MWKPDAPVESSAMAWAAVCCLSDIPPNTGRAVLLQGQQIAVFHVAAGEPCLYALDNFDPKGGANVLSRGIVGDLQGHRVVASPLYKHHYRLADGVCLEDEACRLRTFPVRLMEGQVLLALG